MRKILSYLLIIVSVYLFTYNFNDKINFTLIYMIILAPFFDYFLFILTTKKLKANLDVEQHTIEKGNSLQLTVTFYNNSFIPSFFVEYEIALDSKFITEDTLEDYVMVKGKSILQRSFKIKAIHRGKVKLGLSTLKLNSLLGLHTKTIQLTNIEKLITIYPRTIKLNGTNNFYNSNNSEDDSSSLSNLILGEPGYEYKEYVAGEPLNRVNWKMSSKQDKLQIRKSLNGNKKKKILILDPLITTKVKVDFNNIADLFIESLLALAKELYSLDYDIHIYLYENSKYSMLKCDSANSMEILKETFSVYPFNTPPHNRFSTLNIVESDSCDIILFTTNTDKLLKDFISRLENELHTAFVIRNTKQNIFANEILLKSDYSLEVIS